MITYRLTRLDWSLFAGGDVGVVGVVGEVGDLGVFPARAPPPPTDSAPPPPTDPAPTEPLSSGCRVGGVACGGGEGVALTLPLLLLGRLARNILGGTLGVAEGERRALALTLGLARGLEAVRETEPEPEPETGLEPEAGVMIRVVETFDFTSL